MAHPRSLAIDGWMVEGGGWAEREWREEGDGHGSMIVVGGCRSVVDCRCRWSWVCGGCGSAVVMSLAVQIQIVGV